MPKIYVHYKDELITINPALTPTDSQGTIMDILGEIAGQIKAAKGTTNWWDTTEDSIKGIIDRLGVRPVRAATTANHGLSGLTAVDGVSIVDGDLVLVKNNTTASQNGPWVAHSGAWTRPTDLSASGDFRSGLLVSVVEGTANGHTVWVLSTYVNPIVPGTTSLTFDQIGGSGGGVVDATTSAKGISKLSVAPVLSTNPIAVGDNDPRLSTVPATTSVQGIVKVNTAPASAGDPIVVSENFPGLESYITGLQVAWNSGTSITIKSGACYVPSLNRILNFPSNITKSSLSLSANTWYYLYAWNNSGTPDIEISTTAPGATYKGTARVKGTPDNSRRYVRPILTDGSSNVRPFTWQNEDCWWMQAAVDTGTNWNYVSGLGTATSPTNVSLSPFIPATATQFLWASYTERTQVLYVGHPEMSGTLTNANCFLLLWSDYNGNPQYTYRWMPCDSQQRINYFWSSGPTANHRVSVHAYKEER